MIATHDRSELGACDYNLHALVGFNWLILYCTVVVVDTVLYLWLILYCTVLYYTNVLYCTTVLYCDVYYDVLCVVCCTVLNMFSIVAGLYLSLLALNNNWNCWMLCFA
jgi:hypothetical protein